MKNLSIKLIFLLVSSFPALSYSQNSGGTITGVVRDQSTGETMPGVNVVIEGTLRGASTGPDGEFTINSVAPGSYNLNFTFISFKPLRVAGVEVKTGSVSVINAAMSDQSVELDDIVVVATRRCIRHFSTADQPHTGQGCFRGCKTSARCFNSG